MKHGMRNAFTLIELLIVVAIIAILAGIAVPNLLEAQVRAKVATVKADMRTIETALGAYVTDHNRYPASALVPPFLRLLPLTTPVAYITTLPQDIFGRTGFGPFRNYTYGAMPIDEESRWAMISVGPDGDRDSDPVEFYPGWDDTLFENTASVFNYIRYDPTNGTVSDGDVWRMSDHTQE